MESWVVKKKKVESWVIKKRELGNKNKEGGELGNTKNVLWSKWSHEIVFITHAALIKKKIWANVNNQQVNNATIMKLSVSPHNIVA